MLRPSRVALLLTLLPLVAGCDASEAQPSPPPPADGRFEVRVSNGVPPHWDGVHTLAGDMACAATGGHPSGTIWQAAFELPTVHSGRTLKSFLLTSFGVPVSGGQTSAVHFWLTFGEHVHDDLNLFGISNSMGEGAGSGTLTVERRGRGAVLRVEGTSNQGHTLSAVIECPAVAVVR